MGRAERPEIVDAEFEVVSGPRPSWRYAYVTLPLPNAIVLAICLTLFMVMGWHGMFTASDERDAACETLRNLKRAYAATPQLEFCVRHFESEEANAEAWRRSHSRPE